MADLNKVIAVAEKCVDGCMANCPYNVGVYRDVCTKEVLRDALDLLRSIPRTCETCFYEDWSSGSGPCWSCSRKDNEPPTNWRWKYEV